MLHREFKRITFENGSSQDSPKRKDENKHKPTTTAREVPVFYQKTAKEQIQQMINDGVIIEVTEPTVLCLR